MSDQDRSTSERTVSEGARYAGLSLTEEERREQIRLQESLLEELREWETDGFGFSRANGSIDFEYVTPATVHRVRWTRPTALNDEMDAGIRSDESDTDE
jgi:hypothetical protein